MKLPAYLKLFATISLTILLSYLTTFYFVIVLISVYLSSLFIRRFLSGNTVVSGSLLVVSSFVLYVAVLMSSSLLVWAINKESSLQPVLFLSFVTLLFSIILYLLTQKRSPRTDKVKFFIFDDILAITIAILLVGGLIILPAFRDTPRTLSANSIDFVSMGTDDSNHLGMLADKLEFNKGILYGNEIKDKAAILSGITTYPTSWHTANAVLIKSIDKDIGEKSHSSILLAYIGTKLLWMFLLIYLFIRVSLVLVRQLSQASYTRLAVALTTVPLGFLAYYQLLEQFKEGFYNFIPVLIGLLLLTLLLIHKSVNSPGWLLLYAVFASFSALAWPLALPALVLALILIYVVSANGWSFVVENVLAELKSFPLLILGFTIAILAQLYLLVAPGARSISGGIAESGAITIHSSWFYVYAFLGAVLLIAFLAKGRWKNFLSLLLLISSVAVLCSAIYCFQTLKTGNPQYYYFKSLNMLMVLATPLATYGFALLYRSIVPSHNYRHHLPALILLFSSLPMVIGINALNTSSTSYIKGARTFSNKENLHLFETMSSNDTKLENYLSGQDSIVFAPGLKGYSIIGSSILRSSKKLHPCNEASYSAAVNDDLTGLVDAIDKCPTTVKSRYGQKLSMFKTYKTF